MSGKKQNPPRHQKSTGQKTAAIKTNAVSVNRKWLPYLVLAIMTVFVYSLSFSTEFIYNWDDAGYVSGNVHIKSLSFDSIQNIFSEIYYMSNYHPLTTLSYAIDWAIAGENPAWYHIVNL